MRKLIASFRFAFSGLGYLLRTQRNARLHLLAAVVVIGTGITLKVSRTDWVWLILAIALVFAAEAFNTAIELLADRITSEHDEKIGRAKDLAAAAVLITALSAAGIGLVILGPPLISAFRHP
jgi:diacylglycerol kinase (ATP)